MPCKKLFIFKSKYDIISRIHKEVVFMDRLVGTVSRGIRGPIIRENDDICEIVVDCMLRASESEHFTFHDKDVIALTEAVVARAQGNYATMDQIAEDIKQKFPNVFVGTYIQNRFW